MKISNSKKQLAQIIHENGGWRDGIEFCVSTSSGIVLGSRNRPEYSSQYGWTAAGGFIGGRIELCSYLKNWHQTILSRDEYFHLYPDLVAASEALGAVLSTAGIEPVVEAKPTIEQLAADYRNLKDFADRKQQEADDAKADAEAKLAALVAAGKAHGLVLSVVEPEPELVITDWRDLRVGDEVECIRPNVNPNEYRGRIGRLIGIDAHDSGTPYLVDFGECAEIWCHEVKFIRRPAKGDANA